MKIEQELKPCPFCASDQIGFRPIDKTGVSGLSAMVSCHTCGASIFGLDNQSTVTAWNTRAEDTDKRPIKDELIGLGWELDAINSYKIKANPDDNLYIFQLSFLLNERIDIRNMLWDEVIFSGHITNKSELKKLMIQLGIIKK